MSAIKLSAGNNSAELDDHGNVLSFANGHAALRVPLAYTFYEVNGRPVRLHKIRDGAAFSVVDAATGSALPTRLVFGAGRELIARMETSEKPAPAGERIASWSMTVALPLSAEFHLPEYPNIGRKLDSSIPIADFYDARVFYNFLIVGCDGVWLRFLSEQRRVGRVGVHIERHDEMFLLTVTWLSGKDDADGFDRFAFSLEGRIGIFSSMQEAMADYDRYLAEEVGLKPRACGNPLPQWVKTSPLAIHVSMMRCFGEIENDYASVAEIARALKREGAPRDTVVHIVGFHGPFDTMYPTYRPIPELGGEAGFRKMAQAIHECGFRLSVHVDGCAIDPYHPDIDTLLPLVRRNKDGSFQGYKLAEDKSPPSRRIRFHTDQVPLKARDARSAFVEVQSPVLCESMVTIGGLGRIPGRLSATIKGRVHRPPQGAALDEYRIPYPVHLDAGSNVIELAADSEIDWSKGWFRVDGCFAPDFVHAISTIPLLVADTTNPVFISMFCDEIELLVRTYGVDLVYVDYTTFYHPNGSRRLFAALCERLPDTPFSVEWCDSIEELGWSVFCGGARQDLVKASPKLDEISGRKQVPVTRGIMERYGWLDVASPVCDFVKRYTRFKGMGGSFVPINWVASLYPDHLIYADPSELREVLDNAERLNFVPNIHLNFRRYGIDEHAKRYLHHLSGRGPD